MEKSNQKTHFKPTAQLYGYKSTLSSMNAWFLLLLHKIALTFFKKVSLYAHFQAHYSNPFMHKTVYCHSF